MTQQYRFCHKSDDPERPDAWSEWHSLPDDKLFDLNYLYDFRATPVESPLEDGIYSRVDSLGCHQGYVYSRHSDCWFESRIRADGMASNACVGSDEMSDFIARRDGYVRLVVAQ